MIGSAVHSYRIAPQEQPPVKGIFMVPLSLFRACIRHDNSKYISSRILRVSQPADFRDRHLWHTDFAAALLDFFDRLVEGRNSNRVQRTRTLAFALSRQSAVNSRLLVIARRDHPVFDWAALELLELPPENIVIKRLHRFRVIGINFKVNYAIHWLILLLFAVSYSSWRRTHSIVKSRWSSSRPFGTRSRKL